MQSKKQPIMRNTDLDHITFHIEKKNIPGC